MSARPWPSGGGVIVGQTEGDWLVCRRCLPVISHGEFGEVEPDLASFDQPVPDFRLLGRDLHGP